MKYFKNPILIFFIILFLSLTSILVFDVAIYRKIYVATGFIFFVVFYMAAFILFVLMYKNRKKKVLKVFTLFTAIYACFFISEFVLRIHQHGFEWRQEYIFQHISRHASWYHVRQPFTNFKLESEEFEYERQVNSLGLSDKEPVLEKSPQELRIIGLGDSFTEGDGAHADSTWLRFLERKFNNANYSYINAGICGSDPFFEYVLLRDKLLAYKPDIVILMLGYELQDVIERGGMERFRNNGRVKYLKTIYSEVIYSLSYVYRKIFHKILGYNTSFVKKCDFEKEKNKALKLIAASFHYFKRLSQIHKFEILFAFYPDKDEIINKAYKYNHDLINYAKELDIETLDLLDYYINIENVNEENVYSYYWKNNGHHNAKGYELMAEAIFSKLKTLE